MKSSLRVRNHLNSWPPADDAEVRLLYKCLFRCLILISVTSSSRADDLLCIWYRRVTIPTIFNELFLTMLWRVSFGS